MTVEGNLNRLSQKNSGVQVGGAGARVYVVLFLILIGGTLSSCKASRFFYYPNNKLYLDPIKLRYPYEMQWFPSDDGPLLFGLLFRTSQTPKGIVIHFHGNYGNVSNHFLMSAFLTHYGYDVFVFDYQGYGGSKGTPSTKGTILDGTAAIKYAQSLNRGPSQNVFVFGHSLGGAVALSVLTRTSSVRAAVIQASFTGYRSMAREVLSRSWVGWLLWPVAPYFVGTTYDPIKAVPHIKETPLFFIHGEQDEVVPLKMTKKLFSKAVAPKELWIVPHGQHNNLRSVGDGQYEKRVTEFFDRHVN